MAFSATVHCKSLLATVVLLLFFSLPVSSDDGPLYDSSAYTECQLQPEDPLYSGGMLKDEEPIFLVTSASFLLGTLEQGTRYSFSVWVKLNKADSALIRAGLVTEEKQNLTCIGSVIAKKGCWSFLKGGFVLESPSNSSRLYIKNSNSQDVGMEIASAALQPFTEKQWRFNQEKFINENRMRAITIHVSNSQGIGLEGATVRVELLSRDFPLGSAIASSIIGNPYYQRWFVERFNVAVFENELKWDATEPTRGRVNYTIPDQMMEFTRQNQIMVRGHNIFWENPIFVPQWGLNLTGPDLEAAIKSRIQSLMLKYKGQFIHWDVNNEMLHYNFYEKRLGPNATLELFKTVHQADPLAIVFMNEFNIIETCDDDNSTVDSYIMKLQELQAGGVSMGGIGLQGHYGVPNPPLMRGVLDKLATLGLPMWLTEVDISKIFNPETQALYLEEVLREGFSHPSVDGIVMWSALRQGTCDRMCLTNTNFENLPTGDVVDNLLKEWNANVSEGTTNELGSYSFIGALGQYRVTASLGDKFNDTTFSVSKGLETKHLNIQLQST